MYIREKFMRKIHQLVVERRAKVSAAVKIYMKYHVHGVLYVYVLAACI